MPTMSNVPGIFAPTEASLKLLDSPPGAIRIAMWSVPCASATILMRSFANRADTAIINEPFHAAYLRSTGRDHALREEILASQPNEWREVIHQILGPVPNERPIWYQNHMAHQMLPEFSRTWLDQVSSAFLVLQPESVLASLSHMPGEVTLQDLGYREQWQIFEEVADRAGQAPPVIDGAQILDQPAGAIVKLCEALEIPFRREMLAWDRASHHSDDRWARHRYHTIEALPAVTQPQPDPSFDALPTKLQDLAHLARPYYDRIAEYRLI